MINHSGGIWCLGFVCWQRQLGSVSDMYPSRMSEQETHRIHVSESNLAAAAAAYCCCCCCLLLLLAAAACCCCLLLLLAAVACSCCWKVHESLLLKFQGIDSYCYILLWDSIIKQHSPIVTYFSWRHHHANECPGAVSSFHVCVRL